VVSHLLSSGKKLYLLIQKGTVRCDELMDYREGRREVLDHWLHIQLIGPDGDFRRIEMLRESLLFAVSNASPKLKADEINQRLQDAFGSRDVNLSQMQVNPIGRDGNAIYFSMRMSLKVGPETRNLTGIGAITLLNGLPLSINVYEGTGSSASLSQLRIVQAELLNSLLLEN